MTSLQFALTSRPSSRTLRPWAFVLSSFIGVAACGGETDLNFVGSGSGGSSGSGGTGAIPVNCGNGVVDSDEECDDNNGDNSDGCARTCTVETGWTCDGEPSACVKCGNGTVEGSEQCDDSNLDDGDGCRSDCTLEGSCEMPTPIELTADGDGFVGSVSVTTNATDVGQVGAANCQGAMEGEGADRIFQIDLESPADLTVSVGANFDALVRLMNSPCDLADEIPKTCVDEVGVSDTETASLEGAPAGTYYVVVDGNAATQAGTFSVNVEARCPLQGLKINRVILEPPFRTEIINTNDCALNLARAGISALPEATDTPGTLPELSLDAHGRRMLTSADPAPAGTTYQGDIRYDLEDFAGAFFLCRGECNPSGDNVTDAFRWEGASGPLSVPSPTEVNFDDDKAALSDRLTQGYFRVLTDGVFPDFTVDDYEAAYFVETFEGDALTGWNPAASIFYQTSFEAPDGTIGTQALALNGANSNSAVWDGPEVVFKDNAGADMTLQPTLVSMLVRGSDAAVSHGHVFLGTATGEDDGFGSLFRDNGTLGFGSPAVSIILPYDVETWYAVEYKNFDWAAKTVEVFVDGTSRGTLNMTATALTQLSVRSLGDATAWVDQIIVQ